MPIGPYGGAPGFRRMTSPQPSSGAGYYKPDPRPMGPPQQAPGSQMFSGAFSAPSDSRRLSSLGGARVTPYENYRAQAGTQDMNRQEFWKSGQAPQYSQVNVMRQAMGMPPLASEDIVGALKKRKQRVGNRTATSDWNPRPSSSMSNLFPAQLPPLGLPTNVSTGPNPNGGLPTVSYTLPSTVPPMTYPTLPPSIQPMPPKSLVIR